MSFTETRVLLCLIGTSIRTAAEESVKFAKDNDCVVNFKFNGHDFEVHSFTDPEEIIKRYNEKLEKEHDKPEEPDRITALEEANGQLTDRLMKLEKEFNLLKKPYFEIKGKLNLGVIQGEAPELTEDSPRTIEEVKTPAPYELHTRVAGYEDLQIGFYNEGNMWNIIGSITGYGACNIINNRKYVETYELWREKGMKVCTDKVGWRGKKYWIDVLFQLKSNMLSGCIYDFELCDTYPECKDDNIIRFKHNNRPILF